MLRVVAIIGDLLARLLSAGALLTLLMLQPFTAKSLAQVTSGSPQSEDVAPLDMRRDQWRERVAEAMRRAR